MEKNKIRTMPRPPGVGDSDPWFATSADEALYGLELWFYDPNLGKYVYNEENTFISVAINYLRKIKRSASTKEIIKGCEDKGTRIEGEEPYITAERYMANSDSFVQIIEGLWVLNEFIDELIAEEDND